MQDIQDSFEPNPFEFWMSYMPYTSYFKIESPDSQYRA